MELENRNKKYIIVGIIAFAVVLLLVAFIWFIFTRTTAALPKNVKVKLDTLESLVELEKLNSKDIVTAEAIIQETQNLARDLNSNQQTVVGNELARLTKILQKHIATLEQEMLRNNAITYLKEQVTNLKNALALDYASLVIDNLSKINIEMARDIYIATIVERNFEYNKENKVYSMQKDGVRVDLTLSVGETGRSEISYVIK